MGDVTDGDYVEIVFEVTFVKNQTKETLIERIIMTDENSEWKVSTFSFMSMEEYSQMQAQKAEMQKEANAAEIK